MAKWYRQFSWLIAIIGVAISIAVYLKLKQDHDAWIAEQFADTIRLVSHDIEQELSRNLQAVEFTQHLFDTLDVVPEGLFITFAQKAMKNHDTLLTLEWAPRVLHADREAFEKWHRAAKPGFSIRDWPGSQGELVVAPVRDEYLPLTYVVSADQLSEVKGEFDGLDGSQTNDTRQALMRARLTGQLSISELSRSNNDGRYYFYAVAPVYQGQPTTDNERYQMLAGAITSTFTIQNMFQSVTGSLRIQDIQLSLVDVTAPTEVTEVIVQKGNAPLCDKLSFQRGLSVGGRSWRIEGVASEAYVDRHGSWLPLLALLIGLGFTGLVVSRLGALSFRAKQIQHIVDERTEALNRANQKLELLTLTDALTGVVNRRGFDQAAEAEWKRAIRDGAPITLLIIDVDYFKFYNDHYGHLAGDECLKQVAEAISQVPQRLGDVVARYGGEEFAVLLPNTEDVGSIVAEKCRQQIEALNIKHEYSPVADHVTVSVGSSVIIPAADKTVMELVQNADEALYLAKRAGRNRCTRL